MSKKIYIYSTLTAPVAYTLYDQNTNSDLPVKKGSVEIKGGAGIANKNFITPQGVLTVITEEQYEFLKTDYLFNKHKDAGFIKVDTKDRDVEKAVADMNRDDPSKTLTPNDFGDGSDGQAKLAKDSLGVFAEAKAPQAKEAKAVAKAPAKPKAEAKTPKK